jgi:DNA-damage-inducible protein J
LAAAHGIEIELQLHQKASMRGTNQQTQRIHVRIDPELKKSANRIFSDLGISTSEAIRLFLQQVEVHNGLPFETTIPSEATLAAMEEATHPARLQRCGSFRELRERNCLRAAP